MFYLGFFFREDKSVVSNAEASNSGRAKSISGGAGLEPVESGSGSENFCSLSPGPGLGP